MLPGEPYTYVGMNVGDLARPHVPSVERSCDRCGRHLWVDRDPRTLALADAAAEVICTRCLGHEHGFSDVSG